MIDILALSDMSYKNYKAQDRLPNGKTVVVYCWSPTNYSIHVMRGWDYDPHEAPIETWRDLDVVTTQCVLYELYARRNWRQKFWNYLHSYLRGNS